jgi:hypothetical protein
MSKYDLIQVVQYLKNGNMAIYEIDKDESHIGDDNDPLTTIVIKQKMDIIDAN